MFVYGRGSRWHISAFENVDNNLFVIVAQFASQLYYDDVAKVFLDGYKKSKMYEKHVVMEILASMLYVTMDDNRKALRHMRKAKLLNNDPISAYYRQETEEFYKFLAEGRGL